MMVSTAAPNIILFGETGTGKSSIVNMLAEADVAGMSSGATGCTFHSQRYTIDIGGSNYNIYDTAGLDEGDQGKVPKDEALVQLYKLLCSLESGVSLLIFCMRAPRLKGSAPGNWRFFQEIICQGKVNIALIVTGLELEDPMDGWWVRNKGAFQTHQISPLGFACITATRGRPRKAGGYSLDDEFEESKEKVRRLILNTCLEVPWKMERVDWFREVVVKTYETSCLGLIKKEHRDSHKPVILQLVNRCGLSQDEAHILAAKLQNA
ncbi:hypothetical protein JAAARDRAFT_176274 [Jaapia argillacea MUCL 33604]|uniref:G domain-containing protein n=1 Tax=Jaapia argillacea MUCL 33604 TaxID=933084 RepID=A0A067PU64_9AGAM|nr:hypothetical protein JAAARDRAFT_176274 [Jaapia argillacea MUCL 33604]